MEKEILNDVSEIYDIMVRMQDDLSRWDEGRYDDYQDIIDRLEKIREKLTTSSG